jgi:4-hydroxythreonine-4-phosphate dehydrogenase
MGEPAGIGGEVILKAYAALRFKGPAFFVVDDAERLKALAKLFKIPMQVVVIGRLEDAEPTFRFGLPVWANNLAKPAAFGSPDVENAKSVLRSIDVAAEFALAGQASGIVTSPIQKDTLYSAGFSHPGHTEYLGAITKSKRAPVMMLVVNGLRVVPVTVHIPLKDVPSRLTRDAIVTAGETTAEALRHDFGIAQPRMAVAALNPHAGESGKLGREEIEIIAPAVKALNDKGIAAFGPKPADTLFHARARDSYDAVLCMYHDQALIPLKTVDFDRGVNVTLGLPIVRTSPDHGTALDIAGKGLANPSSLISAIELAADIAARRRK